MATLDVRGQITFLYFDDMDAACDFFGNTLGLPLVCDQDWSKIYQTSVSSYIGAVQRGRGACAATTRDGVLTSLVVVNFDEMVQRLLDKGIVFERPPHYSEAMQIKSSMFYGPEGYKFEMEEFLSVPDRKAFYPYL